jgi:predicted phage tail component-like protein
MMRSKKRPILPESNDTYVQIPGRQGSILYPQGLHDRHIELDCAYVGEDLPDIRVKAREIAAWLHTTDRAILSFDDEPDKYYRGKLAGEVDLDHIGKMAQFTLVFRCEPFVYGGEENQIFVGDSAVVDNQGATEILPRFTVTFINTVGEWKVANQDGEYVRVVNDFTIGDTMEVNCKTGAILINGTRAMDKLDWQNSRFFALREGENTLSITPTIRCNTTVYWTPSYL